MTASGWEPSYRSVCASCHFAIGASLVYGAVAFGGPRWLGLILTVAWALPKDFAWDMLFEKTTLKDEIIDVCFYFLGAGLAFGSLYLPDLYHALTFG